MRVTAKGLTKLRYKELEYIFLQYEEYKRDKSAYAKKRVQMIDAAFAVAEPGMVDCLRMSLLRGVPYEHMPVPAGRNLFYQARREVLRELDAMMRGNAKTQCSRNAVKCGREIRKEVGDHGAGMGDGFL